MGPGPFRVRISAYGVAFNIAGEGVFSGIREMYVRDTYLRSGALRIEDGDFVVDLGVNIGNFTNLALAHGNNVRVVAVEPNILLNEAFRKSQSVNDGFESRTRLLRAFVGASESMREEFSGLPTYRGASFMSETELVDALGAARVDFLKCDIEGGEFALLRPDGLLLRMTRKLAIEIHSWAGDVAAFIVMLERQGFVIKASKFDPDGSCTLSAIRT